MKKKILALCLVVVLAITAVTGATLAYFTDTEEAENVFTIGNIDVKLIESYYHREGSCMDNVPEDERLTVGQKIDDEVIEESGKVYQDYLAKQVLMPGTSVNKMPYVKNTGDNDAYVRIRVMIPEEMDVDFVYSSMFCTSATTDTFKDGKPEFTSDPVTGYEDTDGKPDGKGNAVYTFTRLHPLAPDEMTYWNVWNYIALDPEVTNQDLETIMEADDMEFIVKVEVDAIQADGFDSVEEAWDAFDNQKEEGNSVNTEETYSADAEDGFLTGELK